MDLGCGFGKSTLPLALARPEAEVVGVDLSAPCLRLAAQLSGDLGLGSTRFPLGAATGRSHRGRKISSKIRCDAFVSSGFCIRKTIFFWPSRSRTSFGLDSTSARVGMRPPFCEE